LVVETSTTLTATHYLHHVYSFHGSLYLEVNELHYHRQNDSSRSVHFRDAQIVHKFAE